MLIGIVMSFTVPAVNSSLRGMQLNQATELINDQIRLARQLALTKNHPVEVRFYQYNDPEAPGSGGKPTFRALQSFEINDDGTAKPAGKVYKLPNSVICDSSSSLSPILGSNFKKTWTAIDPIVLIPGIGTNYSANAFQFRPDGSANLPVTGQQWFLTFHYAIAGDNLSSLPPNYSTIQIDPWNGRSRVFRP
jgi:uncharacterized protein (TIGR02596 family)